MDKATISQQYLPCAPRMLVQNYAGTGIVQGLCFVLHK